LELLSILNEMEESVQNASRVPMTKKVLVDEDKMLDFLDRIRTILPEEVRKAKWVVQEREKVINETKAEAARMIEETQKEVQRRAEESEILKQAKDMADEIIRNAEQTSRDMRIGARDYADEVLVRLESRLERLVKEIESGRSELKAMK
jgi:cell division septum initiation protein DivIVA